MSSVLTSPVNSGAQAKRDDELIFPASTHTPEDKDEQEVVRQTELVSPKNDEEAGPD